jgi:hypothetical protein
VFYTVITVYRQYWILSRSDLRETMKKGHIAVVLPDDVKKALESLASEQQASSDKRVYASDVVRDAIDEYLRARGIQLEIKPDRGGYRGGPKDQKRGM